MSTIAAILGMAIGEFGARPNYSTFYYVLCLAANRLVPQIQALHTYIVSKLLITQETVLLSIYHNKDPQGQIKEVTM